MFVFWIISTMKHTQTGYNKLNALSINNLLPMRNNIYIEKRKNSIDNKTTMYIMKLSYVLGNTI